MITTFFRTLFYKKESLAADSWDTQALTEIKQGNTPLSVHTSGGVFKGLFDLFPFNDIQSCTDIMCELSMFCLF